MYQVERRLVLPFDVLKTTQGLPYDLRDLGGVLTMP